MKRTTSLVVGLTFALASMSAFATAPKAAKGTDAAATAPAKPAAKGKKGTKAHPAPKAAATPSEGAGSAN
ncbi:hypothetical protein JGU66_23255 [Myxococcaceae bacterium JPH2]|nr:hypothetical protein [Myxococcaceae bacterium JPH2]